MMTFNAADIVILGVLALSMLSGFVRGFVSGVLSLGCWAAAFWVAWAFGHDVATFYAMWLRDPIAAIVAGYVTCFVGVLIVGALLGWALRGLLNRGGLRGEDRSLGAVFGLARGLLLVTFVVLMLGFTAAPREAPWWRQSTLLPSFAAAAGWAAQSLPPGVTHYLEIGGKSLPALSEAPISVLHGAAQDAPVSSASVGSAPPSAAATSGRAVGHGPRRGDVGQ